MVLPQSLRSTALWNPLDSSTKLSKLPWLEPESNRVSYSPLVVPDNEMQLEPVVAFCIALISFASGFCGFAGSAAFAVFIFDIAFFEIIKKRVNDEGNAGSAIMGNALYLRSSRGCSSSSCSSSGAAATAAFPTLTPTRPVKATE
ncbi:hypothetical protein FB451DRAFT_1407534 [Mycena latifolia]|nr:hypothetical protein FB451DRAFT_1407534 [Mycena latifolia]